MRLRCTVAGCLLALLLAGSPCLGDEPAAEERPAPKSPFPADRPGPPLPGKQYGLRQAGYDARYLVRRPFTLGPRGRRKVYAVAASTVFLYLVRDEIREWVQERKTDSRSDFFNDARTMGKGAFAPALALSAYLASLATKNEREKETALLLLESAAYSTVASAGSFVLSPERPQDGDAIRFFDINGHGVSLDVALAASVVPPLRRQYLRVKPEDGGWKRFGKWSGTVLLYSGVVLTAYQRMDADAHWAPDVFLGATAGLSVGKTLCDAHDEVRRKKAALSWGLRPGGAGLTLTIDLDRRAARLNP